MDKFTNRRISMVSRQISSRGIKDVRVLSAMEKIPRHLFVDEGLLDQAYNDNALPLEEGQTISQPYIVALMTEALGVKVDQRILEIGTGSGYQTAILAELGARVYSIERIGILARKARNILDSLGYFTVSIRIGDGTFGWSEESPFDGIIVTAGAPDIQNVLIEQLTIGGKLVIPVGDRYSQTLVKITRLSENTEDIKKEELGGCRFVNLIGAHGWNG